MTAGVHCNLAVSPLSVEAQVQGAALMGLGTCLPGAAITLKDGVVQQGNFGDYVVPRITDMPRIAVHIVPSAEPPTGMGEPGLPPLAPAFAPMPLAADRQDPARAAVHNGVMTDKPPVVLVLASGRGERFVASGGGPSCGAAGGQAGAGTHAGRRARASGLPYHVEDAGHPGMGDSIAAGVAATADANGWLCCRATCRW